MKNSNKEYFRHAYTERWHAGIEDRAKNRHHFRYQEITLSSLDCFDGCTLLECGCGSGELLARLRSRYPNIALFGLDLGRGGLTVAANEQLSENSLSLIEGDLTTLPAASDQFDRVLCSSVLWYVPEPHLAIAEMVRVLKPGGKIVFDIRPPYHVTNLLAKGSVTARKLIGRNVPSYSFMSLTWLAKVLSPLPVEHEVSGYFAVLPTRLPMLGTRWGNWARYSPWLSFEAGQGRIRWLTQKLLVTGHKLAGSQ